jgi:lysophospholipase L1-like esterase
MLTPDVEERNVLQVQVLRLGAFVLVIAAAMGGCSKSATAPDNTTPTPAAPFITCPAVADVSSATPLPGTFSAPVVTGGKAPLTTKCTPDSGTSFPLGTTTVNCTATDALTRSATCAFTVKVVPTPQLSLTQFFAFGDSITWGEDGQNDPNATPLATRFMPLVQVATPYPVRLKQDLAARYTLQVSQFVVQNEGCGGEAAGANVATCEGAANAVGRCGQIIRTGAYQAALTMEGSNDVRLIPGDLSAEDRAISALQSMVDYAKLFNVRPYLATIPPQHPNGDPTRVGGAAYVNEFNARVATLANAEGIGSSLVDVNSHIDMTLLAPDGLHLRQTGYDKLAQTFFDKLRATAELTVTTTSLVPRIRK